MQNSVQLGTQHYRESICRRLRELREQESLPFTIEEKQQGDYWFVQCQFDLPALADGQEQFTMVKIYRYYLANAITETIVGHWEQDYINRLLRRKYHLTKEEIREVLAKALQYLNGGLGQTYRVHRRTYLMEQILACLDTQAFLDVEGFLRFRAQNYRGEIDKAVSFAVDEFVLEREYVEFIELLKHFLDTQVPRMDTLHVLINSRGKFNLYNDNGQIVTGQFLDEFSVEEGSNEFSYEDLLISSLIAVAPHHVILHIEYDGYKDTLRTISQVFQDRVSYCAGCDLCKKL